MLLWLSPDIKHLINIFTTHLPEQRLKLNQLLPFFTLRSQITSLIHLEPGSPHELRFISSGDQLRPRSARLNPNFFDAKV